jgi:hypothetical protein
MITTASLSTKSLSQVADIIEQDWKNVNYAAKPYLTAMKELGNINDNYGADSAKSVILYFLCNANSWRGDTARTVKTYLKSITK